MRLSTQIVTNDGPTGAGDSPRVTSHIASLVITNKTGQSIQYSNDSGASFTTLATNGVAALGAGNPSIFRLRRADSGAYPLAIDAEIEISDPLPEYFSTEAPAHKTRTTMIVGGHSFAEHHASGGTTLYGGYSIRGFGVWACHLSGGALEIASLAGVGGNTTTQYLARMPEIISRPGDIILNIIGINDFAYGISIDTMKVNLEAIWRMQRNAGKIVAMCLLNAVDSVANPTYVSAKAGVPIINAWICDFARKNPWLVVCDTYSPTVDSLTGRPRAVCTNDGLHMTAAGGLEGGKAVYAALKNILQPRVGRVASNEDSRKVNAASTQLLHNPMLLGALGTTYAVGGTITGPVPDDWRVESVVGTPTITLSSVTPASGIGKGLRVQISATTNVEIYINLIELLPFTPLSGELYYADCDIDVTTLTGGTGLVFLMRRTVDGVAYPVMASDSNSSTFPNPLPAGTYTFSTPLATIPTGTINASGVRLTIYMGATGGTADIVFSRPELRLVTA